MFLPSDTNRQQLSDLRITISDCPQYCVTTDHFGNRKLYGCIRRTHNAFEVQISGKAVTGLDIFEEYTPDPVAYSMLKVQTELTRPGEAIRTCRRELSLGECKGPYEKALKIMHSLHQRLRYVPGSTTVHEAAETALSLGQGVCQDYAHIMLSLLRMEGIPARYVVGMMLGEGVSHAWVEVLCNGYWYGFDPTNDKLVNEEYIRVSCGRDAGDCSVIRGTFYGLVAQMQQERVVVEQI